MPIKKKDETEIMCNYYRRSSEIGGGQKELDLEKWAGRARLNSSFDSPPRALSEVIELSGHKADLQGV